MFLSLHDDYLTFSFYESDAAVSFFTFRQRQVDFEVFHHKSMSFNVEEADAVWHFRVTFSAEKNVLEELYSHLSLTNGFGAWVNATTIIFDPIYIIR